MCILYMMLDKLILKYVGDFEVSIIANNLMRKRIIITGPDQKVLHYYKLVFTDNQVLEQRQMNRALKPNREPRKRMRPTQSKQMT